MASLSADDSRHGTRYGYDHGKCRCAPCKRAKADAQAAYRASRVSLPPGDPRHGTHNGYGNCGCRCDLCVAAEAAYTAGLRGRRKSASGSTKTPLTGPRAVGTPEHDALTRLRSRYQTKSGRLHRSMIEQMLSYAQNTYDMFLFPKDLTILRTATVSDVHAALVRNYGPQAPDSSGYPQDFHDILAVTSLRSLRNVRCAFSSSIFAPDVRTLPAIREIAAEISAGRQNNRGPYWQITAYVAPIISEHPGVVGNNALLSAYLDTDPEAGLDWFLIRAASKHAAAWDHQIVTRMIDRTIAAHPPIGFMDGIPFESDGRLSMTYTHLMLQPNAPTDMVAAAIPHLIARGDQILHNPNLLDDSDNKSIIRAMLDPSHPVHRFLPDAFISRAIIACALSGD